MKPAEAKTGADKFQSPNQKKNMLRGWIVFFVMIVIALILLLIFPSRQKPTIDAFIEFATEMVFVMPAVLLLMGLFSVWIPKEMISRYLGHNSGVRGIVLALLFGSLPTGPLYAAFPLTKELLNKGASPANIFIFLAAWACIKIPQELVEMKFLGWQFMLARLGFTILVVVLISYVFQGVLKKNKNRSAPHV